MSTVTDVANDRSDAAADSASGNVQTDPACPKDLKAEVLDNLWQRPPAPKPTHNPATVSLRYINYYGGPARALLFAVDGVPVKLKCEVPGGSGEVFVGPLEPGTHYIDVVFNFGFGRVGRSPYPIKVKSGKYMVLTVVFDRDGEEQPYSQVESEEPSPKGRK
jgi:hypothetical protein